MPKRILIMGLPGAGKTFLAREIFKYLNESGQQVTWLNADQIREKYDDWDFSIEGRIRQSKRMRNLADSLIDQDYVICDFVAPIPEMRGNFSADYTIWVDTIDSGRFEDTNQLFVKPETYDFHVTEQRADSWAKNIVQAILNQKSLTN